MYISGMDGRRTSIEFPLSFWAQVSSSSFFFLRRLSALLRHGGGGCASQQCPSPQSWGVLGGGGVVACVFYSELGCHHAIKNGKLGWLLSVSETFNYQSAAASCADPYQYCKFTTKSRLLINLLKRIWACNFFVEIIGEKML